MTSTPEIRVRFAPSPTGELHVGGARTALYNYLFARQQGGSFIIRLEDTDQARLVEGSLERLLGGLRWLGLSWDEGPDVGGPYAPYVQSQRLERYRAVAHELVARGSAYHCFCTAQRLEVLRALQQAEGKPTRYDQRCAALAPAEADRKLEAKEPAVVRFRVPPGSTTFTDAVRGAVTVAHHTLDDHVLLKSDGYPTYHLANVVDDHDMAISHVIRGEEWLPSTPRHVLLYQAIGWKLPAFAHLPNVLNEQRAKLSKRRDGEAVWVETYRTRGFLPQALTNFLALLGWHPEDDRELFTLDELVREFSLERVQKAGAIFSTQKLTWFNATYLRQLPPAELDKLLAPVYRELASSYGRQPANTRELTEVLRTRLSTLERGQVEPAAAWFFKPSVAAARELVVPKAGTPERTRAALAAATANLERVGEWAAPEVERALEVLIRPGTFTRQEVLWPVRTALTGERQSPDVFAVAWALGREECLRRLGAALGALKA